MKIIDVAQRTPDWFQWRAQGITASEAPIILGRSPYKTPWRLWAERTGLARPADLSRNPNVQRGNRLEDSARRWFEQTYDTLLLPLCGESDQEPVLRASFDGINHAGEPVELKVPAAQTFQEVRDQGRASRAFRLYEPQVQHQLYVAGADKGWLAFYLDEQNQVVFELARDRKLIRAIVAQGKAFWQAIEQRQEPEKDPARDLFIPAPEIAGDWAVLAGRYRAAWAESRRIDSELKQYKADMDAIQSNLIAMMGDALIAESAGLRITRFFTSGSVDYPALLKAVLPELHAETIERFRRPSSERVRVTVQTDAAKTAIAFDPHAVQPAAAQALAKDFYF